MVFWLVSSNLFCPSFHQPTIRRSQSAEWIRTVLPRLAVWMNTARIFVKQEILALEILSVLSPIHLLASVCLLAPAQRVLLPQETTTVNKVQATHWMVVEEAHT